ncbi:MAG TPA: hypothetical protein PLJ98_02260 [Acholeplasmataceae bacterium]|nr:hypothetical protein [Acholeplasmataceae bacterium]HRX44802.1 hypothetical protein [Acholeplasmataceae bacterium]
MKIYDEFNKSIHREDLMPVLYSGFFISITGGLVAGALQMLFMSAFSFSMSWLMMLVLAHLISRRTLRSYERYHIIYPLLSVFFFIFAYYIMQLTWTSGIFFISGLFNFKTFLSLLNPLYYFSFLSPFRSGFFYIENILDVIFFIVGIAYSYRMSK